MSTMECRKRGTGRCAAAGVTLVESAISVVIVGVMFVAVLNMVAGAQTTEYANLHRSRGLVLAEDLMNEILQWPYMEPGATSSAITREAGEGGGNRSRFDDLDDYHGWKASPPQALDGSAIAWATGYERDVTVKWVKRLPDYRSVSGSETGRKCITVVVRYHGREVASLRAFRTVEWKDPGELYAAFADEGAAP